MWRRRWPEDAATSCYDSWRCSGSIFNDMSLTGEAHFILTVTHSPSTPNNFRLIRLCHQEQTHHIQFSDTSVFPHFVCVPFYLDHFPIWSDIELLPASVTRPFIPILALSEVTSPISVGQSLSHPHIGLAFHSHTHYWNINFTS